MKNLKTRAIYFELENAVNNTSDFVEKVQTVKMISNWVAEHLGYDIHEAEAYARAHIANIVRENEVAKMINRIENDLIKNDINENNDLLIESSSNLLKEISAKLNNSQ
ncbi:MAG: hypothetical protein ACJARD_000469 [Alphaproteobacteria bacterium]|jgi:hypothetical protein